MDFKKLPKDILIKMALDLHPEDIGSLCASDKKLSQKLCDNPDFWVQKLLKDYGINYYTIENRKDIPQRLYQKISENFIRYMDEYIFDEGYPEKLKQLMFDTGYIDSFKNEFIQFMGPLYGNRNIPADELENISDQIPIYEYFFSGGADSDYYPLENAKMAILKTYDIIPDEDDDDDDDEE